MNTYREMVEFVAHRTGVEDSATALRQTVGLFGQYLPEMTTNAMARDIPEFAELFGARKTIEEDGEEQFVLRLASALDVEKGEAFEIATAVGEALAGGLSQEALVHLRKDLPEFLEELVRVHITPAPATDVHRVGGGSTLASGKPGSHKPVSESDVAQADSVAAGGEPKKDRLASATGTEQERLKRTIADGKPGSSRPISD